MYPLFTISVTLPSLRNCAWNPLTALTDLDTASYLGSSTWAEPMARRLVHEVVAVAKGLGLELDADGKIREDAIIEFVKYEPLTTSMRSDTHNHRPLEVEVRSYLWFLIPPISFHLPVY
jgi:ketopantoate reductase